MQNNLNEVDFLFFFCQENEVDFDYKGFYSTGSRSSGQRVASVYKNVNLVVKYLTPTLKVKWIQRK